jgi:hypothetical protein
MSDRVTSREFDDGASSPPAWASSPPAGLAIQQASSSFSSVAMVPGSPTLTVTPIVPAAATAVSAKDFYIQQDCLVRTLLVLYYGLIHDDGTPIIDLSKGPWSKMKKSAVHIVARDYQAEITHCWEIKCKNNPELKSHAPPCPSQWTLPKV